MSNVNEISNRHLRTIGKAAEWLRIVDSETPIRYSTIRNAVLDNKINCVAVGAKRLVLLEDVYRYFYGTDIDPEIVDKSIAYQKINQGA
ncbi:MAG: hypothetical protein E7222_13065 [Clostridiales bacterium]|nr:hypothetical protein [Clostridiales bacterium]